MGRWAQQNRRGGGGKAAVVPGPIAILDVIESGTPELYVSFNDPVTADGLSHLSSRFTAGGKTVAGPITQSSANEIVVTMSGTAVAGDAWALTGPMPGVIEQVVWPASGTVIS